MANVIALSALTEGTANTPPTKKSPLNQTNQAVVS